MTIDEAPIGTICVVGNPHNGVVIQKVDDDTWNLVNTNIKFTDVDVLYRMSGAVWIPGHETKLVKREPVGGLL